MSMQSLRPRSELEEPGPHRLSSPYAPMLAGWAVWAAAAWGLALVPATFDEPLWLRWARACAEHRVRTPLAVGLGLLGCAWLCKGPRTDAPEPGFGPEHNL